MGLLQPQSPALILPWTLRNVFTAGCLHRAFELFIVSFTAYLGVGSPLGSMV